MFQLIHRETQLSKNAYSAWFVFVIVENKNIVNWITVIVTKKQIIFFMLKTLIQQNSVLNSLIGEWVYQ